MLLAGDGNRVDLREVGQFGETVERELEAVEPEERISVHFTALPSAEESFRMAAVGEVGAERRAGAGDAAVICSIMRDDGEMARIDDMAGFLARHSIPVADIGDLLG